MNGLYLMLPIFLPLVGGLVSVIIAILVSPPYDPQSVEEELAAARERN